MKKFILASALGLAAPLCLAQALPGQAPEPSFDFGVVKTHVLANMQSRIQKLEKSQHCVQNATTFSELRRCPPPPLEGGERPDAGPRELPPGQN